jgi:hypothetical protein
VPSDREEVVVRIGINLALDLRPQIEDLALDLRPQIEDLALDLRSRLGTYRLLAPVGTFSIFLTTNIPSTTLPNTQCLPSRNSAGAHVMKNWVLASDRLNTNRIE